MNTYVIMIFDKPTKMLLHTFEISARSKGHAVKILKSNYTVDNTYIIKCFKKRGNY